MMLESLKGILHPKMKILSFTHPQVVANLHEFLSSAEHKGRYFEERLKLNSFFGTFDFQNTMEVNGAKVPAIPQISSFVFSRRKKLMQGCNNLGE